MFLRLSVFGCAVLAGIISGCASERRGRGGEGMDLGGLDPTPLDEKGEELKGRKTAPGDAPAPAKVVDNKPRAQRPPAPQYAASLADDNECEQEVRRIDQYEQNNDAAWELMVACIKQDKFTNLEMILTNPWRSRLDAMGDGPALELIAGVISARGATFELDVPLCQKSKLPLYELNAAFTDPALHKDRYVVLRGVVNTKKADKRGAMVLEIDETARLTQDVMGTTSYYYTYDTRKTGVGGHKVGSGRQGSSYAGSTYGRVGSEDGTARTGRVLLGKLIRPEMKTNLYEEYVFLARFDKVAKPGASEDEEEGVNEPRAEIRLIRAFKPGTVMPQMTR